MSVIHDKLLKERNDPVYKAKRLALDAAVSATDVELVDLGFMIDDFKLVWFNHTLKNWKALIMSPKIPKWYFEVTYNHVDDVTYVDAYFKQFQKTDKKTDGKVNA